MSRGHIELFSLVSLVLLVIYISKRTAAKTLFSESSQDVTERSTTHEAIHSTSLLKRVPETVALYYTFVQRLDILAVHRFLIKLRNFPFLR